MNKKLAALVMTLSLLVLAFMPGISLFEKLDADAAAIDISGCTFKLSTDTYTYNGAEKKPVVTVTYGDKTLKKNTDYTVTYSSNIEPGTGLATVNGIGAYTGKKNLKFTIKKISVSGYVVVLGTTSYTYDGTPKLPSVTVRNSDSTVVLKNGTDYRVEYSDNIKAGTATVTVYGQGYYNGKKSKTFTIKPKEISECSFKLSADTFTYDGTAKRPAVTVTSGGSTLKKDTHYYVSYSSNIEPGTGVVSIDGKGNYTGRKNLKFTINKISVSGYVVVLGTTSYTYDGTAKTPSVTVRNSDSTVYLKKGTDYRVEYSDNTKAGTATVTVYGQGYYNGKKSKTFTISPKDISVCTFKLSADTFTYDGTAKKPAVTVTAGDVTLKKDTHYTVTYSSNTEPGTGLATIDGKGNYTGRKNLKFTINKISISGYVVVLRTTSYTYDGNEKKPSVTVRNSDSTVTLKKGTDYRVEYSDNLKAGTATVTVYGMNHFNGKKSKTFTIKPRAISECTFALSCDTFTYDGTAKRPTVTVSYGDSKLKKDYHYYVSYSKNIEPGTGLATIDGTGNFTGRKNIKFTINKISVSGYVVALGTSSYTYDGNAKKPSVTVRNSDSTVVLKNGTDYKIVFSNNVNAGTATVTVYGQGHYNGKKARTFTINPKSIAGLSAYLDTTSYTYAGTAFKPAATVKDGTKTLVKGTDYTVTYANNKNAGTATATVKGKGNYTGSKVLYFTIGRADISGSGYSVTFKTSAYTYNGEAKTPTVVLKNGNKTVPASNYTVEYKNNINAGKGVVILTGSRNFTGKRTAVFTINPASVNNCDVALTNGGTVYTYTGRGIQPAAAVTFNGTVLTEDTDYTVSYENNLNCGLATVVITGIGNFADVNNSLHFTIKPKSVSGLTVTLTPDSFEYDGTAKKPTVTVKDGSITLKQGTDYTVEFKNNIDVGTATAVITGTGNYMHTVSKTFTIVKTTKSITNAAVTLSGTSFVYTGSAIKPSVTVVYDNVTLKSGTDYILSYLTNVNAGTGVVKITGTGDYTGTSRKTFTITAKSVSGLTASLSKTSYVYDGTAKKPTVTITYNSKTLTLDTDYTVAYKNNINVGTATVTVTGKGNFTGTKNLTFKITEGSTTTGFQWGTDNWKFINDYDPLCNYSEYYGDNWQGYPLYEIFLNSKYRNALESKLDSAGDASQKTAVLQMIDNDYWGGSCYGMAVTSVLEYNGILKPSSYKSGATSLYQLTATEDVVSLINYYYALQQSNKIVQQRYDMVYDQDGDIRPESYRIKKLLNAVKDGKPTVVAFTWSAGGHGVVAYGVETGSWKFNNRTYTKRVLMYNNAVGDDKGVSIEDEMFHLYINSSETEWIIPGYDNHCYSYYEDEPAMIQLATNDKSIYNYLGYIGGTLTSAADDDNSNYSFSVLSSSKLNSKATYSWFDASGAKTNNVIPESNLQYSRYMAGNGPEGFDIYMNDPDSGYSMKLDAPEAQDVSMRYANRLTRVKTTNSNALYFAPSGYVEAEGENTDYEIKLVANDGYTFTDWNYLTVSGKSVDSVSVTPVEEGYIVRATDLFDVSVSAQNDKDADAYKVFSTDYTEVLVYEIDENTIGIKVDTDGNGTFETDLDDLAPISLDECEITVSESEPDLAGSAVLPEVTVLDNTGKALAEGTDYTVSYSEITADGTAAVTVTGTGDYEGTFVAEVRMKASEAAALPPDGESAA